jgi:hypothetical protein
MNAIVDCILHIYALKLFSHSLTQVISRVLVITDAFITLKTLQILFLTISYVVIYVFFIPLSDQLIIY